MTAPRKTTARTGRRRVAPDKPIRTAAEVASLAPKAEMPSAHELGAQLEATAHAAGRFWHALGEAGLPRGFRVAIFNNWQLKLFESEDAMNVTDDAGSEFHGDDDEEGEAV